MGPGKPPHSPIRWAWTAVLAAHAIVAAAAIARVPHRFASGSLPSFANDVVPLALLAACLAGAIAGAAGRTAMLRPIAWSLPLFWLALAVSARLAFPESLRTLWLAPVCASVALGALGPPLRFLGPPWRLGLVLPASVLAAAMGVAVVLGTAAPAADTRPIDAPRPENPTAPQPVESAVSVGSMQVDAAEVRVHCGDLDLAIRPLLTFGSVSSDGFWATSRAPSRVPEAWGRTTSRAAWFSYSGAYGPAHLEVSANGAATALRGWTRLDRPVWSHLNSFVSFRVPRRSRLAIRFAATGARDFEISPADYPYGRPMHLAWLERDGAFRVAIASTGEKGPFEVLASGRLAANEPVSFTLSADSGRACHVELSGWASQAGFAQSPTAGWGLPVNAVEFFRDPADGEALVSFTLAGTSVGWGLSTAGHQPGSYETMIKLQPEP